MRVYNQAAVAAGLTSPGGVAATNQSTAGAAAAPIMTSPNAMLSVMANVAEAAVGEYAGTGAAQDVVLPFDPLFVLICGIDNTVASVAVAFATTDGQTAAKSMKLTGAPTVALIGANGVVCGTAGQKKFSLGSDASINENGKKYSYIAVGV